MFFRPIFVLCFVLFFLQFYTVLHFCILFLMYFHNICALLLFFFCGISILFSKYVYRICKYEYFTKFRNRLKEHYRHGPTLSIFFSERRVYCIFSTFLGSNQRYHVTSLFTNIPQNENTEIGLQCVCQKISTTGLVLHIKSGK